MGLFWTRVKQQSSRTLISATLRFLSQSYLGLNPAFLLTEQFAEKLISVIIYLPSCSKAVWFSLHFETPKKRCLEEYEAIKSHLRLRAVQNIEIEIQECNYVWWANEARWDLRATEERREDFEQKKTQMVLFSPSFLWFRWEWSSYV